MRFTPDNFLRMLKDIVPGSNQAVNKVTGGLLPGQSSGLASSARGFDGGFKKEVAIPLPTLYNLFSSTGNTATLVTISSMQALETTFSTVAVTSIANFEYPVTRDYDENSDTFVVRLLANNSTGVNTNTTLNATMHVLVPGTAVPSTGPTVNFAVPFAAAGVATTLPSTATVLEAGFVSVGLKRDDVVAIVIGTNGGNSTTTDHVLIWNVEAMIDSCLVSFNETDLTSNATGTLPGFGNALR